MIYSGLFLEKNEKLILLFLITYKKIYWSYMRFAYAVIGFMKNLILKTKKVLRNIAV